LGDVLEVALGQLEALGLALTALDQRLLRRVIGVAGDAAADRGSFASRFRLFLLDELLVALLVTRWVHQRAAVSEAFSVELLLSTTLGGGAGRAIESGSLSLLEQRPTSHPTTAPARTPIVSRVTVRNGLRANFDAVPRAVRFAVVLTAWRAS